MEPYSDAFKNAVCLFICPYSHLSFLDSVFLSICPPIIWSSVYSSKHPSVSVFWQSACLSLHTHICPFVCPRVCLSVHMSAYLVGHLSIDPSIHQSQFVWQSVCLSLHTHICPSVCPYVCHSVHPSTCLFPCLYVCLTVCLSIYSIYPFFCPPVCMNMFRLK